MANITKKVSWSSRAEESGATGEGTPLLNGSEQPRQSRQVRLAWLAELANSCCYSCSVKKMLCHVFYNHYKIILSFKCCMGYECLL